MVHRIGADNKIKSLPTKHGRNALCKICLYEAGTRHFHLGKRDHPRRKVHAGHRISFSIKLCRQNTGTKAKIQNRGMRLSMHRTVNRI